MRKHCLIACLIVALAGAMTLAGCSGGDDADKTDDTASTTTE